MSLVVDIETVSLPFDSLSDSQKEYILRYPEREKDEETRKEKIDEAIRFMSLYPLTAKIIVIGMLNTKTGGSLILYENKEKEEWDVIEKNIKYRGMDETEMLKLFWEYAAMAERIITFNGRTFDIPFIMMRSAINKVKPSKNFMGYRFDTIRHIDLMEQFTFYGLTKKFNLDFYCQSFGIESPKSKGVTGMEVSELYKAGRIKDIAIYCGDDIKATFELYKIWDEYLNI